MEAFYTWTTIGTYAGSVALTAIIVQAFKGVGFLQKIPTQLFSYIVAVLLLVAAQVFTREFALADIVLCFVNAVVVSLASNGAYTAIEKTVSKSEQDYPDDF